LKRGNCLKKLAFSFLLLFSSAAAVFSQDLVIAVSDFTVESRNPSYEFLGKGISRLVASELRKSGKIRLVEREAMNKLLEEQQVSLSALTDEKTQVRIGMMLSAKYLVMGEIIDMGAAGLLVSVRMADVETGEVIWQDEKQEKLAVYDYMGAFFAKSMLEPLKVAPSSTTVAKIERKEEKKEEAIIKTSEGIDAYDRRDTAAAKTVLEEAKALDPGNDVTEEYLAKLVVNTTKFKVMLEPYYPDQNPAYLGIIRADRLYFLYNVPVIVQFTFDSDTMRVPLPNGNTLMEMDFRVKIGYSLPVLENLGLDFEAIWFANNNEVNVTPSGPNGWSQQSGIGGICGAGLRLTETFSMGLGAAVYAEANRGIIPVPGFTDGHPAFALSLGILYKTPDEGVVYDAQMGYCSGTIPSLNADTADREGMVNTPLFLENTLSIALDRKRSFIIVKQLNDISYDRVYYYGRLIPAFEHFVADWFSYRIGAEGAFALLNKSPQFGYGIIGGLTYRIIDWGMDIDVNLSYRMRPSRTVEGFMYPDFMGTLLLSFNDLFVSRRK
jgi:TolB-like protein